MSNNPTYASNWHAEFISCNTSLDDQNTRLNAYYVGQELFFHFMLMGGSPGDKITVIGEIVMNDQIASVKTLDISIGNGSAFYFSVIPHVAGKLTIRLYYKNEKGERVDLQGAYAYVQNNASNTPTEKKSKKKKSSGLLFDLFLLGVILFIFYLIRIDKIHIPGISLEGANRTTVSTSVNTSAGSSTSSSAGSSAGSSARSNSSSSARTSAARTTNGLEGTTWKYVRDVGSYVTMSFSNGTVTSTFVNVITGDRETRSANYTIRGNMIDLGDNVLIPWEISGNQLILTVEGEKATWDRQ